MAAVRLESATASQVTSKKEAKLEDKGNNRAQDIRIENFDVAYGNRCVEVWYFLFVFPSVLVMDVQTAKFSGSNIALSVTPNFSLNFNHYSWEGMPIPCDTM